MLYAILAYHDEKLIAGMTAGDDAGLMARLLAAHDRINRTNTLGPAARLDFTGNAVTLRGPGEGIVVDGPFAETKEQLLGFYLIQTDTMDAAVEAARELRRVNTTAVYEIRPVKLLVPGDKVGEAG